MIENKIVHNFGNFTIIFKRELTRVGRPSAGHREGGVFRLAFTRVEMGP